MGRKKTKYHDDFKNMVVELYHSGRSVKELSSEYGISEVTIYKWIKNLSPLGASQDEALTLSDLKQIQKEMQRLREENEILKKAMVHIR